MSAPYSETFYEKITPGSLGSARAVLPIVFERFSPASIVDLGCGSGAWLSVAGELGVVDLTGVDGPWVPMEAFAPGAEHFVECDLAKGSPVFTRRFDMAFSTEVAEHLPPARSEAFVDLLCSLSDVVMFSAAIPQQGGVDHINERWQSFWVGLFRRNGYGVLDIVRPRIWDDAGVSAWYRQNLFVFARGAADEVNMVDVVHPYFVERGLSKPPHPRVRAVRSRLRRVKVVARKLLRRRSR